jgi:hypothetical protein
MAKSDMTRAMRARIRMPPFSTSALTLARFGSQRAVGCPLLLTALCACAGPLPSANQARVSPAYPTAGAAAAHTLPKVETSRSPSAPRDAETRAPVPRLPEITLDPKAPLRALPAIELENIGLHIGGGPNDAESKRPFLRAILRRFPAFLDCYRESEEPAKGGRFGIDLHIARAGGHPRVEQPRTALRGAPFRDCLSTVFASVEFERPKRGATTISYSLRFNVLDPR